MKPTKQPFEVNVRQALQFLSALALYQPHIFMRELLLNASDAIEKRLYSDPTCSPRITLTLQPTQKTLTMTDNGIGMTHAEAAQYLGRLMYSGTQKFIADNQLKTSQLAGEHGFGVFLYFLVAQTVVIESRHQDAAPTQGVRWVSQGDSTFEMSTIEKETIGTTVILTLKDSFHDYLNLDNVRLQAQYYADYLPYPLYFDNMVVMPPTLLVKKQNSAADYIQYYHTLCNTTAAPLYYAELAVKADMSRAIYYVPAGEIHVPLKLYSGKVLVLDDKKQLLPDFLQFIGGVVQFSALAEPLQQCAALKRWLIDSVLNSLERLLQDTPDSFKQVRLVHGAQLSLGYNSPQYKIRLQQLMQASASDAG